MFNLEGFIPKLCQLAQEVGEDERAKHLRAAALQALSAMVFYSCHHHFLLQICLNSIDIFLSYNLPNHTNISLANILKFLQIQQYCP